MLLASLIVGCSSEAPGSAGSGTDPQATAPLQSSILLSSSDVPVLDADDPDAGTGYGGLEFDPSSKRLIVPEIPIKPRPFKPGSALPVDSLGRDEQPGAVLLAAFRSRSKSATPQAAEADAEAIAKLHLLTAPRVKITLTAMGRMKFAVDSRAMALPFGSEIRARYDRLGHVLLWPDRTRYRVVSPGSMRTTLGERRVDATPLQPATATAGEPGKLLDQVTRSVQLETSLGKVRLQLATVSEAALGGPLLCRFLVELVGVDPAQISECRPEEVPLSAAFEWASGGGFDFEVTQLTRRADLPPGEVLVPPPGPEAVLQGLPEAPDGIFLTRAELATMRSKALPPAKNSEGAPAEGLIADNQHEQWLILMLDGVPVVGVPANQQRYVIGALSGKYHAEWRSFLGDLATEKAEVELPARLFSRPQRPPADAGQ